MRNLPAYLALALALALSLTCGCAARSHAEASRPSASPPGSTQLFAARVARIDPAAQGTRGTELTELTERTDRDWHSIRALLDDVPLDERAKDNLVATPVTTWGASAKAADPATAAPVE